MLYRGLLYPSIALPVIGGYIEGNELCALDELFDGIKGVQLF